MKRKAPNAPLTIDYFRERSRVDNDTGCWLWTQALAAGGYGAMRFAGKNTRAHRGSFETFHGLKLPSTVDVCHRCDVRLCVNPDHLFAGSRADNMADCSSKGRIRTPALRGDESPNSKLTAAAVLAIRADARCASEVAADYGVTKSNISCIRRRATWRHV